jgi:hypothetical protein
MSPIDTVRGDGFLKTKVVVFVFSTFIILIGAQNCSLYQNEGRKFLDSNGLPPPKPPGPRGQTVTNTCLPHISDNSLISVYGNNFDINTTGSESNLGTPPTPVYQCLINAGGGAGTLLYNECFLSHPNREFIEDFIDNEVLAGITPLEPAECADKESGDPISTDVNCEDLEVTRPALLFYAFQNPENAGQVIYNIDMAKPTDAAEPTAPELRGVKCRFILNVADWPSAKTAAKARGRALVEAFFRNIAP